LTTFSTGTYRQARLSIIDNRSDEEVPVLTEVHLPESAAAAATLLRDGGWLVGGGTVVMPRVNTGAVPADRLVSLRHAGLAGIRPEGSPEMGPEVGPDVSTVVLGAATTLAAVGAHESLRFLRPVIRSIASPPVRNLATVGGNLVVGRPHGDLAVALLALDARVEIVSPDGVREVGLAELSTGPGDVLSAVRLTPPAEGTFFYRKAMRRRFNSASIVTVAAVVGVADGVVVHARIALGGVAARPMRAAAAEAVLVGSRFDPATVQAAAEQARAGTDPVDDAYASAWYRDRVLPVHVRRALLDER
jgi:CO/xanthine dehydrogenase FAD-binding subunit